MRRLSFPTFIRDSDLGLGMSQLLQATPVLSVRDVNAAAAWYGAQLGFSATFYPDGGRAAFAILERDGTEIMLECQPFLSRFRWRKRSRWDVYLRVDDVEPFVKKLETHIARSPANDKDYGCREVELRDLDGHVLVLSQRLS